MISSKRIVEQAIKCYDGKQEEINSYIQGANFVKVNWGKLSDSDVEKMAKWFLQGSDFKNCSDFSDEKDRIKCLKQFYRYLNQQPG